MNCVGEAGYDVGNRFFTQAGLSGSNVRTAGASTAQITRLPRIVIPAPPMSTNARTSHL